MHVIRVRTWAGFETALQKIRKQYGVYRRELTDGQTYTHKNNLLFRGQGNAAWRLATTLERKTAKTFDVYSYVRKAYRARNEIESFTGQKWNVPKYPDLEDEIKRQQDVFRVHLPAYDYLVYLRHHGYPSPLLDWTESTYIAAFFAYQNAAKASPAVYCYIERPTSVKGGSGGAPMISVMGPFVSTHKRHFAQKAWYTISTEWDNRNERHSFCPHENVFARNDPNQDVLVKIVLPATKRSDALQALNDFNINQFTLFQSEDSLIKALEFKHFDLNDA